MRNRLEKRYLWGLRGRGTLNRSLPGALGTPWAKTGLKPCRGRPFERDSAYLATANSAGQPYVQHRGGPKGFIRVLDDNTLGFADFVGNRQYITTGNLAENDRAFLFLMDYAHRQRIKIWGRARVVENDAELLAKLMPEGYDARPQQAILFTIEAWDVNCPQHIPQKFDAADVAAAVAKLERRVSELEAENARLRESAARTTPVKTCYCLCGSLGSNPPNTVSN